MASRIELPNFQSPRSETSQVPAEAAGGYSFTLNRSSGSSETGDSEESPASRLPLLPRTNRVNLSRHRHDANPALALKVLHDIYAAVEGWHEELRQTIQAIQALYLEGPIVEGWLEAMPETDSAVAGSIDSMTALRHAELQQLQDYVEALSNASGSPEAIERQPGATTRYRLCRLDSDGRLQCQLCPPDQLHHLTLAVARHQRLRQYLNHKQYLEARLKRAVEVLTRARSDLDISPRGMS